MTFSRSIIVSTVPLLMGTLLVMNAIVLSGDRAAVADSARQTATAVNVDLDVSGNAAVAIGRIDACKGVRVNDEFPIDILVDKVTDLNAWEMYLQYDRSRLEVLDADVGNNSADPLFLGVSSNSSVIDVSDPLPNRSGLYRLAAADIAIPAAPERGTGVLARVTMKAKAAGVAAVSLPHLDYNSDTKPDLGPRLMGLQGSVIGDSNGDGFLDSPISPGQVAIGTSCSDVPPPTQPPSGSGSGSQPGGQGGGGTDPGAVNGGDPGSSEGDGGSGAGNSTGDTAGEGGGSDSAGDPGSEGSEDTENSEDGGSIVEASGQNPENRGPNNIARSNRNESGGLFEFWMLGPAAGLGLLGAAFTYFTLRRSGIGL